MEDLTLYTMRKLYGAVSYELFSKDTKKFGANPSYNVWLNNVLGHSKDNLETSNNYSHVHLTTAKAVPNDIVIKQSILENKISSIEERLDESKVPELETVPLVEARGTNKVTKNKIMLEQFSAIDKVYDKYFLEHEKAPTQAKLELLAKSKAPRQVIRLYIKYKKENTS